VSKPPMKHRKTYRRHRNRGTFSAPGQRAALGIPSAWGRPACSPGGVRCIGGVSSSQALAWNRRSCRLDTDGQHKWVKVAPWLREGGPRPAETGRGRVPMRGTVADRSVVVMKAL
jgi:hypothetical protein